MMIAFYVQLRADLEKDHLKLVAKRKSGKSAMSLKCMVYLLCGTGYCGHGEDQGNQKGNVPKDR